MKENMMYGLKSRMEEEYILLKLLVGLDGFPDI